MSADFMIGHEELEVKEGRGRAGYTRPGTRDRGQETINGISRKNWGLDPIFVVLDELKGKPGFPDTLDTDSRIRDLTLGFYRRNFWDALGLDSCFSQQIANELYEQAVNMGRGPAGRHMQEALNFLNAKDVNNQLVEIWPPVKIDGKPGPITHQSVEACAKAGRINALYDWMNVLQGEHLAIFIRNHPDQRPFAVGLVRRVNTITNF